MGPLATLANSLTGGRLFAAEEALDPMDDHWYTSGPVYATASGLTFTPKMALQVSALFQGLLVYALIGTLPFKSYRERRDGRGKDRARDHFSERLFHTKRGRPNAWQTGGQIRETMIGNSILYGAAHSEIRYARNSMELWPLDPDTMKTEQMDDGRLRYKVGPQPDALAGTPEAQHRTLVHEQVWRVEGPSFHRFIPPAMLALAREAWSHWQAMQRFNSLYFRQGAGPRVFIKPAATGPRPSPDAKDREEERIARSFGLRNFHKPYALPPGADIVQAGWSAKDSQLSSQWEPAVREAARWLNLPADILGAEKTATHASAVEYGQRLKDLSLVPVATRVEASISRDIIPDDDVTIEHDFNGFLRGNPKERFETYAIGVMNGIISEDEARGWENLNPVGLDEPRRSVNQDRGRDPRESAVSQRLELIAEGAVARVIRRELGQVGKRAAQAASGGQAWEAAIAEFYSEHARYVAEALELPPGIARRYCDRHRAALLAEGLTAAERWEEDARQELLALAFGSGTRALPAHGSESEGDEDDD